MVMFISKGLWLYIGLWWYQLWDILQISTINYMNKLYNGQPIIYNLKSWLYNMNLINDIINFLEEMNNPNDIRGTKFIYSNMLMVIWYISHSNGDNHGIRYCLAPWYTTIVKYGDNSIYQCDNVITMDIAMTYHDIAIIDIWYSHDKNRWMATRNPNHQLIIWW